MKRKPEEHPVFGAVRSAVDAARSIVQSGTANAPKQSRRRSRPTRRRHRLSSRRPNTRASSVRSADAVTSKRRTCAAPEQSTYLDRGAADHRRGAKHHFVIAHADYLSARLSDAIAREEPNGPTYSSTPSDAALLPAASRGAAALRALPVVRRYDIAIETDYGDCALVVARGKSGPAQASGPRHCARCTSGIRRARWMRDSAGADLRVHLPALALAHPRPAAQRRMRQLRAPAWNREPLS